MEHAPLKGDTTTIIRHNSRSIVPLNFKKCSSILIAILSWSRMWFFY